MNSIEVTKEAIENKFTNAVDYFGLYIPNLLSFYALFTKRVNNDIKSMRVCVKTDVTPYLEYNEEWVCSIDKSVFVFIMAIELYRFILHHCTHRELQGPNAYKASTAVCNSKELQFFLSSAPSDIAEYVRKTVWSKITVEDELGKKIDKDDFYYEAVYDMLNQQQEQQQQSQQQNGQSQDGEGQENQQTKESKKDKGADNGEDENDNRETGDSGEGDEDQEDQSQGEGEGREDRNRDGSGD